VEFCHVRLEANQRAATIYVVGLLADLAATRTENVIASLSEATSVVRMDLRGVQLIDPSAFVRVARSLKHWRDLRCGSVTIEVPERSQRVSARFAKMTIVRPSFCDGDTQSNPDRYIRSV
jgi:hypothetical protein